MTSAPPTAIRWHRIIGVIILALLFAEGAARLAVYVWSGQPYRSLSPYVWSPYGVVRNNPRLTSPAFVNDKSGFRDVQDFSQRKPANTLRVMLLGASTMYSGLQGNVWDVIPGTERIDSRSTIAQFLRDRLVADPALAGLNIEVINAAVNMNRIVEISSAYLAEYAYWSPDFVIVGGSANNFGFVLPKGSVQRRDYGFMSTHVWRSEFERIVNRNDLLSAYENGVRALADHSAAAAVGAKLLSKVVDAVFGRSAAMARHLDFAHQSAKAIVPADWDEYDQYVDEYLGYASAMVAMARHNHQHVAFFWEHFLAQIGKMKHLTENEKKLFEANLWASSDLDAAFTFHARDRVAAFLKRNGVPFLDPIERLITHSGPIFIDYVHYTAEGNRFMAEFIYDQLRESFHRRAKEVLAASERG